ncbi:MAG: Transcriptional regulator, TetR family protein [Myxococcales bacterium]|nr:Transcriptional regulator, TetR family protein [Myxococcales bacterium]
MDVRTKILEEATRLFAAHGVDGTALQEIADAVGVKKPSLLYHFPSKEALHASVLEDLLSRWNEIVPRLLHAVAREDRFDAVLDACIAFFTADPDRARLLLREAIDRPGEMRALLSTHVTPWLGVMAESIKKAQADGSMRKTVDAEAYILQIIHMVIGTFTVGATVQVLLGHSGSNGRPKRGSIDPRLTAELKRVARIALKQE